MEKNFEKTLTVRQVFYKIGEELKQIPVLSKNYFDAKFIAAKMLNISVKQIERVL